MFELMEEAAAPVIERDPIVEARVETARGFRKYLDGDPTAQLVHSRKAANAARRGGDLRHSYNQLMNVALGELEVANWAAAEATFRETLEGARGLGLETLASATQNNLGWALACAGRTAEARIELNAAIEALEKQLDRRMLGGARMHLARVHLLDGRAEAAEEEALAAAEILDAAPPLRPQSFAIMAYARLAMGCLDEAMEAAMEGKRQLDVLGRLDMGDEAYVIGAYATALQACGDPAAAEAARAEGAARLLERAARISDPRLRQAYLHDRPDHAAFFD